MSIFSHLKKYWKETNGVLFIDQKWKIILRILDIPLDDIVEKLNNITESVIKDNKKLYKKSPIDKPNYIWWFSIGKDGKEKGDYFGLWYHCDSNIIWFIS